MWIYTQFGFFSAVKKKNTDFITIRARVKKDLENLKVHYGAVMSDIVATKNTDYPYRAAMWPDKFVELVTKIAADVTYDNFKDRVMDTQGIAREEVYADVWLATRKLTQLEKEGISETKMFE